MLSFRMALLAFGPQNGCPLLSVHPKALILLDRLQVAEARRPRSRLIRAHVRHPTLRGHLLEVGAAAERAALYLTASRREAGNLFAPG